MTITSLLAISLGAILTNNFIFAQFLGCCPFLGVSKKIDTAVGMGAAVTFVMGLASAVCFGVKTQSSHLTGSAGSFDAPNSFWQRSPKPTPGPV